MRLRTQVLVSQSAVVAVALGIGFAFFVTTTQERVSSEHGERALAIARAVAADPDVRAEVARLSAADDGAVAPGDPDLAGGPIQDAAESIRAATGALFVVVTDDRGLRLAHPDATLLGHRVSTDPGDALAGHESVVAERGTLGPSVRAKVPVFDPASDARASVGEVSVGIATGRIRDDLWADVRGAVLVAGVALVAGVLASTALARRFQRLTLGLEPEELGELVRAQDVVLHGISEGVVGTDPDGRVTVVNEEAVRLLDLSDAPGRPVDDVGLTPRVLGVLREADGTAVSAAWGERALVVSARRVVRDDHDLGTVMTVRDRTDVETLTRELDAVRALGDALRAQRHEFANRMHLVQGLLHHGRARDAAEYITGILGTGEIAGPDAGDAVRLDPYLSAFLAAKAAHARERSVDLVVGDATWVAGAVRNPTEVTTVIGNLVDNAIDAAGRSGHVPAEVEIELVGDGPDLHVTVSDTGDGISDAVPDVFVEGATTHTGSTVPGGRGIGLATARRVARATGGDVVLTERGGERTPDNPTGGAVFVATLRAVLAPTPDATGPDGEAGPLR